MLDKRFKIAQAVPVFLVDSALRVDCLSTKKVLSTMLEDLLEFSSLSKTTA
jgi:hypothetical protein